MWYWRLTNPYRYRSIRPITPSCLEKTGQTKWEPGFLVRLGNTTGGLNQKIAQQFPYLEIYYILQASSKKVWHHFGLLILVSWTSCFKIFLLTYQHPKICSNRFNFFKNPILFICKNTIQDIFFSNISSRICKRVKIKVENTLLSKGWTRTILLCLSNNCYVVLFAVKFGILGEILCDNSFFQL